MPRRTRHEKVQLGEPVLPPRDMNFDPDVWVEDAVPFREHVLAPVESGSPDELAARREVRLEAGAERARLVAEIHAAMPEQNPNPVGATVVRGQSDGWAGLVMRGLGFGDALPYDGFAVACVCELQESNELEPDGIVYGLTWAYVLREIPVEATGHEALIARKLLGLDANARHEHVREALVRAGYEGSVITQDVWVWLILTASGV